MRVISGSARNTKLMAPEGLHTRPVTDMIKQAVFNIWQFKIEGCTFLDLFSGSCSIGIEALSRQAKKVVMIDNDNQAIKVIKANLKKCHLDDERAIVIQQDVLAYLMQEGQQFDIIYADPPFTVKEIFKPVMENLSVSKVVKDDTVIAIRCEKDMTMESSYGTLEKYNEKKYGISIIHFYRRKRENV